MRERLIRALGGYTSFEEALQEARATADRPARRALLAAATRRLFNTIDEDDLLKVDKASSQWTYMGRPLGKEEMMVIIQQAKGLIDSRLWAVLLADIKYQANRRIYIDSKSEDDLVAGKLLLYLGDIIHTRVKRLASL